MEEFTKVLGTKRQLLMAYHPQTDGQTERINQEIGTFLRHYMNYQQDNWTDWLSAAEFQYNDKKHAAMGRIPFELNFGRHPWKEDLMCYDLGLKVLSNRTTLVLSNTRELDRVPSTK